MSNCIRVYVAGPITPHGVNKAPVNPLIESLNNIRRGIRWCLRVWREGYVPFCAYFDFVYWLALMKDEQITEPMIKTISLAWLEVSQAVFVIPNRRGYTRWQDSRGTEDEIKRAKELGMPIFYTLKALRKRFPKEKQ